MVLGIGTWVEATIAAFTAQPPALSGSKELSSEQPALLAPGNWGSRSLVSVLKSEMDSVLGQGGVGMTWR